MFCRYAQYVHTFHAYRPTYARGNTLVTVKWGNFRLKIVFFCVFLRYLCQFLVYKKLKIEWRRLFFLGLTINLIKKCQKLMSKVTPHEVTLDES